MVGGQALPPCGCFIPHHRVCERGGHTFEAVGGQVLLHHIRSWVGLSHPWRGGVESCSLAPGGLGSNPHPLWNVLLWNVGLWYVLGRPVAQ